MKKLYEVNKNVKHNIAKHKNVNVFAFCFYSCWAYKNDFTVINLLGSKISDSYVCLVWQKYQIKSLLQIYFLHPLTPKR